MIVAAVHCGIGALLLNGTFAHLFLPHFTELAVQGCFSESAVIVFFVISGLCISLPYVDADELQLLPYFIRRQIRILPPCILAIVIAGLIGVQSFPLDDSNMWSIVCEEIYYVVFPLLLWLHRRFSWDRLIAVAHVFALVVIATKPSVTSFHHFGNELNWIVGYPAWLWGCKLAEQSKSLVQQQAPSTVSIWVWRLGVLAAMIACSYANGFTAVHAPLSLSLFAPLAYMWLSREICYAVSQRPAPLIEWAGRWSYSIYLIHLPLALASLLLFGNSGGLLQTVCLRVAFILGGSFAFFLAVEYPSLVLAKMVSKKLTRPVRQTAAI